MRTLTKKEHQQRHVELHMALDELLADYMLDTGQPCLSQPIEKLLRWSHGQTQSPRVSAHHRKK